MNTASSTPSLTESRELARLLVAVADRARADLAETMAPSGLPTHLARAVLLIEEPTAMRTIAAELACDPSHVTGIADQLEQRGLARRTTGCDRRVKLLALTPEGEQVHARLAKAVEAREPFGHQLSPAQHGELRDLLQRLQGDGPDCAEN